MYKYDLQMQVKKAIDPVVIRHDIAKMLRLEEERGVWTTAWQTE